MAEPTVHGPDPENQSGGRTPHGGVPGGENAGAAVGAKPANVKEITDSGQGSQSRGNPGASEHKPAWIGMVEDLLKAGGKELWSATKQYVKEGNLSLFSRRNPAQQENPQQEGSTQETSSQGESSRGEPSGAPEVPSPDHFEPQVGQKTASSQPSSGRSPTRANGHNRPGNQPRRRQKPAATKPSSRPAPPGEVPTPGDLARVEVGSSVLWVHVTGRASGSDDYEGRLAHPALGLAEGAPVTFARRHLLGREQEAPKNPTPKVPEGISGERVREPSSSSGGPLPPRF